MKKLPKSILKEWKNTHKQADKIEQKIVNKIQDYLNELYLKYKIPPKDVSWWFPEASEGETGSLFSGLSSNCIYIELEYFGRSKAVCNRLDKLIRENMPDGDIPLEKIMREDD